MAFRFREVDGGCIDEAEGAAVPAVGSEEAACLADAALVILGDMSTVR